MTLYITSFIAYFITSFALGIIWYFLLFKDRYQTVSGGFASENPIFAIGFIGITLHAIATVAAFLFAFPILGSGYGSALLILLIMWVPHYVNNLGTAAKYEIKSRGEWLLLELGFNLLNVVALATVLHFVYLWLH